jgi:hypothetical protein
MVSVVGLTVNGVCVVAHVAWPAARVPVHSVTGGPPEDAVNVTVPVGTAPPAPGTVAE